MMYKVYQELRDTKGVTDYRVAKDTGINQSVLTMWKQGQFNLKVEKIMLLADYFGVPLEMFLNEMR